VKHETAARSFVLSVLFYVLRRVQGRQVFGSHRDQEYREDGPQGDGSLQEWKVRSEILDYVVGWS
jgi:hypothetical protein